MTPRIDATRRRFFGFMAASPLAAKAAGDKAVAELVKADMSGGGSSGSVVMSIGTASEAGVPVENRLMSCVNYVKMFGLPKEIEEKYRSESQYVSSIDYDIANKKSWSLAVKVMTQRQRNYQKRVEALEREANKQFGLSKLRKILGFEFPTWY